MTTKDFELFEDYNKLVEQIFNELYTSFSEDDLYKLDDNLLSDALKPKETVWQNEKKGYLDGISPKEYIASVSKTDDLIDLFTQAALGCDRDIPNALTEALIAAGSKVYDILLDIAFNKENRNHEENVVIPAAAIFVLGKTNSMEVLEKLIVLLKDCTEEDALIMESITNAIKHYGVKALEFVSKVIQKEDNIDFRTEYLIMILPELSKDSRSDEIYRLLKNSFLIMDNKILGASALAEYGDGRAIPAMRGFLEKNASKLDRETFYEIKKSIEILGGNIEGIVLPNFTAKKYNNFIQ